MLPPSDAPPHDQWSDWLLTRRHGGDPAFERRLLDEVARIADRILNAAELRPGITLADVGAGDGFLAFSAIERIGPSLRVILTDVSAPLLQQARANADRRGIAGQCRFIVCPAETLQDVPAASVDVLATRAALAFVPDKPAALRAFHRVLRPGGTLSLGEPILQDEAFETAALKRLVDARPDHPDIDYLRILQRFKAAQFPSTDHEIAQSPITNFSERDLVRFARDAGFADIHVELHIDARPILTTSWDIFLRTSPHPWSPTGDEILARQFSAEERARFERILRPMIESGRLLSTDLTAYLTARKPTPHPPSL